MRVIALSALLIATGSALAFVFEDDFDSGLSPFWTVNEMPDNPFLFTRDYSNGKVKFSKGGSGIGLNTCNARLDMGDFGGNVGDFVAEIDMDQIVVPQSGINQVELRTFYPQNGIFVGSYSNQNFPISGVHCWDGGFRGGLDDTSGQGRMKIVRQGTTRSVYFSNQLVYQHNYGTSPAMIALDFVVQNNPSGTNVAGRFDNFRLEFQSPQVIGTLNLEDTVSSFAVPRPISYAITQGTVTVGSGTLNAKSPSRPLFVNVAASVNGPATLVLDGSSFLKRRIDLTIVNGEAAVGAVTMANGDPDQTGEVDAADIDLVIANFGNTFPSLVGSGDSDVDCSGEVDAADIDIVIGSFGEIDE